MGDLVKQILVKPIQLSDQVIKAAENAGSFRQECSELKSKTEKLAGLLRQVARASNDLYDRPTRRIIEDTQQALDKTLSLVLKCRGNGLIKRVFTIIPAAAFRKMSTQLDSSIGDVSWLLRVSVPADDRLDEYLGLPPIAANEPILYLIWEQIAILYTGSIDDRADAAGSLVSLARDNDRYGKLIIEEGGIGPLLKLLKEGKLEGQENAATAIGLLGKDPESVEHLILAGVCSVFVKVLQEGPMKVQAVVAWATSELAAHYPKCQDLFAQHNIIRLLVSHLAFETVEEHSKYAVVSKATSVHAAVVLASSNNMNSNITNTNYGGNYGSLPKGNHVEDEIKSLIPHPLGHKQPNEMLNVIARTMALKAGNGEHNNHHHPPTLYPTSASSNKAREMEHPDTKSHMKEMAARALWKLAKGNPPICRSITESRALLCFAVLLDKAAKKVQYNSAMALMEITAVAEEDAELRKSAFKPNSPACKAVVDQLFRIIEKGDSESELFVPCIKSVGNLARTFRATETIMISPLVSLLDDPGVEVPKEACVALTKFACSDNYLHVDHSKAIIGAGGAKHLVQLVYLGEQIVQKRALILLSYVAMYVPDSEEFAQAEVLTVLEWASKQAVLMQDGQVEELLMEAIGKLELYQSRGARGFNKV